MDASASTAHKDNVVGRGRCWIINVERDLYCELRVVRYAERLKAQPSWIVESE
jgi:hypothetical protein